MKKVLIAVLVILIAAVAGVLIVPGFVDWNNYKGQITARVKSATGRDLVIGGDIKVSILPAPVLEVDDVRLSNLKGAVAKDMVRLKTLKVSIAFGPLLSGNIQVKSIRLVDPVIELEALKDGRTNWQMDEKTAPPPPKASVPAAKQGGGEGKTSPPQSDNPDGPSGPSAIESAISFENIIIENGTLVYRDSRNGTLETVKNINARVAAATLVGPFESNGKLVARGIPLSYDISLGEIIHRRTIPVSLSVSLGESGARARVSGAVIGLNDQPKFKGEVRGEGKALASLIAAFNGGGDLPGFLAQDFEIKGAVSGSASGVDVRNLTMRLGDARASGVVSVDLAGAVNIAATLRVTQVNADKWLAMPTVVKAAKSAQKPRSSLFRRAAAAIVPSARAAVKNAAKKTPGKTPGKAPGKAPKKAPKKTPPPEGGFAIPDDVNGSVTLVVDSITFKGGLVRKFQASAELAGGEVTLSQFSAQLPGSSDLAVFGFITAEKGQPKFEGEFETSVGDLRGVLKWLGVSPPPVPKDRLRKLTLASRVTATPREINISGLDIQFDSSRITGRVSASPGKKTKLGVDLTLDRINLDAYLAAQRKQSRAKSRAESQAESKVKSKAKNPPPSPSASAAKSAPAARQPAPANPLAALSALGDIQADIKVLAKKIIYKGTPISDIRLDALLADDALAVRNFSIARMAGARLKLSGGLTGLSSLPKIKNLVFDIKAGDPARLARLAGTELPIDPKKLGKVTLKGRASGSVFKPAFNVTLGAAGGTLVAAGNATLLPLIGGFDVKATARHKDTVRLLRALDIAYRPGGRIGGLDISARIKGNVAKITLSEIRAAIGKVVVNGTAGIDLAAVRPKITADLTTGEVLIDPFMPAKLKKKASKRRRGGKRRATGRNKSSSSAPYSGYGVPAAGSRARQSGVSGGRWPGEPFDLSALRNLDASVALKSKAVTSGAYRIENVDLGITLSNGVLRVEKLAGNIFGGALSAQAVVRASVRPGYEAALSLSGVDVGRALKSVAGQALTTGKMGANLKLSSTGNSIDEIVSALAGGGKFNLSRLDVKGGAKGSAMSGIFDLLSGLNQLGGTLTGGKRKGGLADVSGSFSMNRGVAKFSDLRLESAMGSGRAKGSVDIYRWVIDVDGRVNLAQNLLTQFLVKKGNAPMSLPFRVSGRLDAPDVKLDTASLPGGGIQIPGVSGLRKKLDKKGLGGLVDGILGGVLGGSNQQQKQSQSQQQPQSSNTPPPPPPPPPSRRETNPQDLIRGLLRGLGR